MTGAHFEISIDGKPRTCWDTKEEPTKRRPSVGAPGGAPEGPCAGTKIASRWL
jgi:hypothetical protein